MSKTALIAFLILVALGGVWWYMSGISDKENTETTPVTLFYYNPSFDQGPGGAQCSEAGLVGVEREVAAGADIEDVISLLLQGSLTSAERAQGVETEFPLEGLELVDAAEEGGVLTLTFVDPQNKTSGGSCRVSILRLQIEATAKEFTGASEVRLMPEDLFQP